MVDYTLSDIKANYQINDIYFDDFFNYIKNLYPDQDLSILEDAYLVSSFAHKDQKRKSGEPYLIHPIEVTKIVASLGLSVEVLVAALLHDTVEDTPFQLAQIENDFGKTVAFLVDGVTKLNKLKYGGDAEVDTIRKMIIAMTKDIRVIIVKICDRLHNARTWCHVPRESAVKKARQTLDIYAPLADRLGLNAIKLELQNLSFQVVEPKAFEQMVKLVERAESEREELVKKLMSQIDIELKKLDVTADISGRPKHYYSIWQKMQNKQLEFSEVYDLIGIRIITESIHDCYVALGVVHTKWIPIASRFKDYIAVPKPNMYQSLHTGVIIPDGSPIEFQIRTKTMHQNAEYGIAAHWKYKLSGKSVRSEEKAVEINQEWIKQLSQNANSDVDSETFFSSLSEDLNSKEVFVFTPQGATKTLPINATPVDFAYSIHSDVGAKTIGARVNGKLSPLSTKLKSGDTVEILTSSSPNAAPSKNWEDFVVSTRARNKIRQYFTKERQNEALEAGKEKLITVARKQNVALKTELTKDILTDIAKHFNYKDIDSLYIGIGGHQITAEKIVTKIISLRNNEESKEEEVVSLKENAKPKASSSNCGVLVKGNSDILVKLAKCCTPMPPDKIGGFITRGYGVSVHRNRCPSFQNLKKNEPGRVVDVSWITENRNETFLVNICIEIIGRKNMLADIAQIFSKNQVLLDALSTVKKDNVVYFLNVTLQVSDIKHLQSVFNDLRQSEGVLNVLRK